MFSRLWWTLHHFVVSFSLPRRFLSLKKRPCSSDVSQDSKRGTEGEEINQIGRLPYAIDDRIGSSEIAVLKNIRAVSLLSLDLGEYWW